MTRTVVHDHFPLLVALLHGRNIDDLQNGRHVHLMAQIRYGIEQGHVGASEPRIGNLSVVRHLALTHGAKTLLPPRSSNDLPRTRGSPTCTRAGRIAMASSPAPPEGGSG